MSITNEKDWRDLLSKMGSNNNNIRVSGVTETDVDFMQYTVIAVFDKFSSGVGDIDIVRICDYEDHVTVKIVAQESLLEVINQPFHIAKIPKTEKEIIFEATYTDM